MGIKPIKTELDYRRTLKAIDRLMDAKLNTREGDALDILASLVERWEEEHFPIEIARPD